MDAQGVKHKFVRKFRVKGKTNWKGSLESEFQYFNCFLGPFGPTLELETKHKSGTSNIK